MPDVKKTNEFDTTVSPQTFRNKDFLFHVTDEDNIRSIAERGIVPDSAEKTFPISYRMGIAEEVAEEVGDYFEEIGDEAKNIAKNHVRDEIESSIGAVFFSNSFEGAVAFSHDIPLYKKKFWKKSITPAIVVIDRSGGEFSLDPEVHPWATVPEIEDEIEYAWRNSDTEESQTDLEDGFEEWSDLIKKKSNYDLEKNKQYYTNDSVDPSKIVCVCTPKKKREDFDYAAEDFKCGCKKSKCSAVKNTEHKIK